MSILSRYILKQHSLLLLATLSIGIGIYLIIDLVERAEKFLAVEGGAYLILPFYLGKLPVIISQILPAVFLLACVILLCIMIASRENIALQAGGIPMSILARLLMYSGIFWAIIQFILSQFLATYGENVADNIWRYQVRQNIQVERSLDDVWFTKDNYIVYLDKVFEGGKGQGFLAYELSGNQQEVNAVVRAEKFVNNQNQWTLQNVQISKPSDFQDVYYENANLILDQSIKFFFIAEQKDPQNLDFVTLFETISRLESAGSNVEFLKTVWYGKITYAASIIVFAFVAVAIITYNDNVYLAVMLAVISAFLAYVLNMVGAGLSQEGKIPPAVGTWGPQLIIFLLAYARIQLVSIRK